MGNLHITEAQYRALLRQHLSAFIQYAFSLLEPFTPYCHSPHIDLIADRLTRCHQGEYQNLIINMPPRMMKSLCASVIYPAWILGHNPSLNIMCLSYSEPLARELSMKFQTLINTPEYQALFPHVIIENKRRTQFEIKTTLGGGRLSIPIGGSVTGFGANVIILDDPIKPSDAHYKHLYNCNRWYDENVYQRLNMKNTGKVIVIMQRVHEIDLTGHLLEKSTPWEHLTLPAIAERHEYYPLLHGIYERQEGEALHPERESLEHLMCAKKDMGSYVFAGQYQQRPAPAEDGVIQRQWFQYYHPSEKPELKQFKAIIQSWDTAMATKDQSDYSVGITIGMVKTKEYIHYYVLDVIRKKMDFPTLHKTVEQQIQKYSSSRFKVVIEDAASGTSLIQALKRKYSVTPRKPINDKITRTIAITDLLESEQVYLPHKAPWLEDFLSELTSFPRGKHDDQVDAFTQALQYFKDQHKYFTMYDNL